MKNYKFSCSTMWNVRSHENGIDALKEIAEMGFEQVELNYLVSKECLSNMLPFIESGGIEVSSIHNVFPKTTISNYDTDSILLGYPDDYKRKESIRLTKQSIDYAQMLGAKAVVLHVSAIKMSKDYDTILRNLYSEGKRESDEYKKILDELLVERETQGKSCLEHTLNSMLELSEYIEKKQYNVQLGIENRAKVDQVPTLEEMDWFSENLKGTPCCFWYDIGHGILMENLGLLKVFPHISKYKDRLAGMHIHDADGIHDHFYPYKFGDGFDKYLEFIESSPLKVFEIGPKCNRFEVENSLKTIKNKL